MWPSSVTPTADDGDVVVVVVDVESTSPSRSFSRSESAAVLNVPCSSRIARPEGVWMSAGRGFFSEGGMDSDARVSGHGRKYRLIDGAVVVELAVAMILCMCACTQVVVDFGVDPYMAVVL